VITKYMIAFLDRYIAGPPVSAQEEEILTPEYALTHLPAVQFFRGDECPYGNGADSFLYRPFQTSMSCVSAPRDPAGWFTTNR
jgi:hypothetical protein